jgi:hypothetical protein
LGIGPANVSDVRVARRHEARSVVVRREVLLDRIELVDILPQRRGPLTVVRARLGKQLLDLVDEEALEDDRLRRYVSHADPRDPLEIRLPPPLEEIGIERQAVVAQRRAVPSFVLLTRLVGSAARVGESKVVGRYVLRTVVQDV